eukprot:COSAG06_NODE_708_length_12893_cov_10.008676_14_plen_56_part_00
MGGQHQLPGQHLLVYCHSRVCIVEDMKVQTAQIATEFIKGCMQVNKRHFCDAVYI